LLQPVENHGERRHFLRVKVNPEGGVSLAGKQASHILSSMAASNALLDLPPHASLPAGATVHVLRW
jgi:molybdopterin biosynthesis enzyme